MFNSLVFFLLSGNGAQASTYYLSDVGIRAMGRGGAFVAGADDISAQWYNPSALTRIHGTHFQFDVMGVKQQVYFDRLDYPGEGPIVDGNPTDLMTAPIRNTALPLPIPHLGFIHDFGNPNLTVLIGFTSPYATDIKFPEGGAQRYSLEDSLVIHTFTGPAIAYKVKPWLSIGFGTSWNYMIVGQSMQVALQTPFAPCDGQTEDPQCDIGFEAFTKDAKMFTWNLSATVESMDKRFAGALMFQPKIKYDATGWLKADFSNNIFYENGTILSETSEDDHVTLTASLPMIIRSGLLFRPKPTVEVELSAIYEGWSTLQSLDVQNVNMTIEMTEFLGDAEITDDISLPTNFTDSYSLRLGWDWDLSQIWNLRQGVLYESTGLKQAFMNPALVDRDKIGLGLGASWSPNPKWTLDTAFFGASMGSWEVNDSKTRQISVYVDPFGEEGAKVVDGRPIANGTYRSSSWLGGLSLTHHFGQQDQW